jgi:hypothetical protein
MPPGFSLDVAKVVANIDRIETDTLRQMNQTTLDRQGQIRTLVNYYSLILVCEQCSI